MEVENGSMNSRVTFCRDFPPGCGISSSSFNLDMSSFHCHHYTRDFPPGCGSNFPKTTKKLPENASRSGIRGDWRRSVTAVKSTVKAEPRIYNVSERKSEKGEKMVEKERTQKVKAKETVMNSSGDKKSGERGKVLEILSLFRRRCNEISNSGRGIRRVDTTAYNELKSEGKLINRSALMLGDVPGVEVGDKFHYRIELVIIGLHKQTQGGIDSMEWGGGRIATSIVANERHSDKMNDPNSLIYVGEGGVLKRHEVGIPPDQELKGGNHALWSSMKQKKPVRVIRGLASEKSSNQRVLYVYDGLYEIRGCEKKKGQQGNMIFEFQMTRCSGQPAVPWQACRRYQF
ncbi:Histone-lysine N-methyltransferase H3 lysine-9 specific SUVH6 [Bienertia sinuspersici]